MLKANELRLGNAFEYRIQDSLDERKDWWEFSTIDSNDLAILESNVDYDYRPIKLTDKIILGIKGFEKVYNSKYTRIIEFYNSDKMQLVKWTYKKEEKKFNLEINGHSYPHIECLHQLQNLFFFLFSEELIFSSTER